ncbi:MAG TPA: hypothetical protein VH814_22230 [Steroidobacteraceae bacterium]|jgi:hypothetical protein
MKAPGLSLLCLISLLASSSNAAETAASLKQYAFGFHTLHLGDTVRRGSVKFNVDDGMTEDELDAVNHVLDERGASPVDDKGYRELSLPNGTHVRIGGFLVEGFLEDSVEGVHSLPGEFAVNGEFSTDEAALVLQIAKAGNLFVGSSSDAAQVAAPGRVTDKRFAKRHKQVSITADEPALAEWVRQNIAPALRQ